MTTSPPEPTPDRHDAGRHDADDEGTAGGKRIGGNTFAQDLFIENTFLRREVARLESIVAEYGIQDAVDRSVALEDLAAEHAIQQRRLSDLIAEIRQTEATLSYARDRARSRRLQQTPRGD
jgi:hypothetical protein